MGILEMKKKLPQVGRLSWIGLRPKRREALEVLTEVEIDVGVGLVGDHYSGKSGKRQVTLIQGEHIDAVEKMLHRTVPIDPGLLRRNLVVYGVNLYAFKDQPLQIGAEVILEVTGECHPCSRMEENLGPGGYNAMRHHGGITTRVLRGGKIKLGDPVKAVESPS